MVRSKKRKKSSDGCCGRRSSIIKRKIRDGTSPDDDDVVVSFFETLMLQKEFEVKTPLSDDTKSCFKEFFDVFNQTKVNINKYEIQEMNFTEAHDSYIANSIKRYIDDNMKMTYVYKTDIGRPVIVSISFSKQVKKEKVVQYLSMMMFWLQIATKFALEPCKGTLTITLYLTDLKKVLVGSKCSSSSSCIISKTDVNTGYSTRCDEIVIFREEEWFKVFVHETIHNLGLDFSISGCHRLKTIFNITNNFDMKLREAYTESWARIINALLLAYDHEKTDFDIFANLCHRNILLERLNAFFQTNKILKYQGLDMDNLTTYDEETANFSYYIIVAIFYSDYQDYIKWNMKNNPNVIQFDNKNSNQKVQKLCDFIQSKASLSSTFRKNIKLFEQFFVKDDPNYLYRYMKKSILSRSLIT